MHVNDRESVSPWRSTSFGSSDRQIHRQRGALSQPTTSSLCRGEVEQPDESLERGKALRVPQGRGKSVYVHVSDRECARKA